LGAALPYAELHDQRLFYEDTGGDRPVIAFSHGLFMDHSMFDPQVQALRDRFRCITWDQRGHGQTGDATGPFTYWDSANDLAALLHHLGVQYAVLAGMSQGGFLSLRAALTHPGLVRALILIDTQAGVEDPERLPYYAGLVERWMTEGVDQELLDIVAALILGQGFPDTPRWQEQWRQLTNDNLLTLFTTLASREDIHDRLPEIDKPAVVIHGSDDASIRIEKAEMLSEGLGGCSLSVIPGAGHAANLTHPELVTPRIEEFLAALG
jgi:pimeloyl-ACP methyl ester carboxylesterase